MKKLFAIAMTLCLLISCAAACAEGADGLCLGYIASARHNAARNDLTAQAFAYAAEKQGARTVILRYDPESTAVEGTPAPEEASAPEATAEPVDYAVRALESLIEDGEVDGVAVVPETLEQALRLIEVAKEDGLPIVIEGLDISPAFPPDPDPDNAEDRPYVACVYSKSPAYTAAMWLDSTGASLALHSALPVPDPDIQAGLELALAEARYLGVTDEINASANSAEGGYETVQLLFSNYTLFDCVLADSAALAEGCAAALREADASMPIAVADGSAESLELLRDGQIDMVAGTPAPVEGIHAFRALQSYLLEGKVPANENRLIALDAAIATKNDFSAWLVNDMDAAYALIYPEEAQIAEIVE